MSVEASGQIVLVINSEQKPELYQSLKKCGLNMKQWFLKHIDAYLKDRDQMALNFDSSSNNDYQGSQS